MDMATLRPPAQVPIGALQHRAQGQEEMVQVIQVQVHLVETQDMVPIQDQEETHHEVVHLEVIHPAAIDDFLHLHHLKYLHSNQEELDNLEEIPEHLWAHLHHHLVNDLLMHGHH